MPADTGMIDTPPVDGMVDAMPTAAEAIDAVRGAANGAVDIDIPSVTVTYLKPAITGATPANDPAGFFVQAGATGPALFVAVDPATLSTLTPALAVGDVVSFTVTEKGASGSSPRATMISDLARSATGTNVAPLAQDITAVSGIAAMIADFDSELVDVTAATIGEAWGASGSAFSRTRITTAGQTAIDPNFQLRVPTTFKDDLVTTKDLGIGCVVAIHHTPVNRFSAQFQVSAFTTTDLTVTSCPAPTVASAAATDATHVTVTFSRAIDMTTLLADGTQFGIVDDAMPTPNPLPVTAAALTGPRTITLTTNAQTPSTMYTVSVTANTLKDVTGGSVGTPSSAMFSGFVVPIPTVMMAAATSATAVTVTFTRPIEMTSVMTDGTQFTIVDDATPTPNPLAVTAASVSGMTVTLTTDPQTPGTMYTVTVVNSVTDTNGTPVGAPLSASFMGFMAMPVDHLVINEIDYDNNGTDNAEFIEIYNPTASAISLTGKRVVLVNGDTSGTPALYSGGAGIFDLGSLGMLDAGQYLVIGSATLIATLPGTVKTLAFAGAQDQVQNGPRDSAYLIDVGNAGMSILPSIIDSVSYEGNTSANLTYSADGQNIVLAPEGTTPAIADLNNANGSVCRLPNGADTNANNVDLKLCSMQSPGATNIP